MTARRVALLLIAGVLGLGLIALLPIPVTETTHRYKRYLVTIPANSVVNLTGWTQTFVPLGVALFGSRPYILNFG